MTNAPKLRSCKPALFGAICAAAAFVSSPALADRIDGKWCSPDGKHVEIEGPKITTPGGAKMEGSYSRHAFQYVVPAAEPESGSTVYMVLLNEETMEVRAGNPVAKAIVWKRCQNIS